MAIDNLFDIQFTTKLAGSPLSTRLLRPSDFFDMNFVASRDIKDIRCTCPWKYDFLQDYLKVEGLSQDAIQWLQIDIVQRMNGEHRRVTEQHWGGHRISVDWVKTPFSEPVCVVLLHLKESIGENWQHVKIQLVPMSFAIRGHWVTSGGTHGRPETTHFIEGYDEG